jgi:fibronectin type 3 domain-containing protein
MSLPLTILAGQPVSFNVAFTPQNSGAQSGALSFSSNASNSTTSESLSGTGTVTSYSVNLYWNTSSDVAGYNVYRSSSANGSYAKINPSLNATTAYTDSTVVSGQTYYYEATAVNSSGAESALSAPAVQAQVP